jgi:hypothetical protein
MTKNSRASSVLKLLQVTLKWCTKAISLAIVLIIMTSYVTYKFYKQKEYDDYLPTIELELNNSIQSVNQRSLNYITCAIEPKIEDLYLFENLKSMVKKILSPESKYIHREITVSVSRHLVSLIKGNPKTIQTQFNVLFFANNLVYDFSKENLINYYLNNSNYAEGKTMVSKVLELENQLPEQIEDEILTLFLIKNYRVINKDQDKFLRKLKALKSRIPNSCKY